MKLVRICGLATNLQKTPTTFAKSHTLMLLLPRKCSGHAQVTSCTFLVVLFAVCAAGPRIAHGEDTASHAKGVVFHDANENQKFDDGEEPLPDIRVSNGRDIVRTDESGRYRLPVDDDTILFVIKPRGWRTPVSDDKLPQFYYIHKPDGSPESEFPGVDPTGPLPESVDFPLYRQEEPEKFRAILFGDTQPRNQEEVDYIAHDVVEPLIGAEAAFGVTLGDIVFDDLSVFEPLVKTVALIGIPWYNVIGNHDLNFDAEHDHHSDETFERVFGPAYYSFDYGPVHFMVLDDVQWFVPEEGDKGRYRGGLGEEQMDYIRQDLSQIPEDQMVVLMMHIPLVDVEDREELFRLIEQRPFCLSISAHTHHHEHRLIKEEDGWMGPEPHHHIINVTACGSWWRGAPGERGIPHATMADGAPNGYSILTFDGTDYKLDFRAAGRPADYQMQIHAPEEIAVDALGEAQVYVNFFNGSERSKLEMRVGDDGPWSTMSKTEEVDPVYQATYQRDQAFDDPPWIPLPGPKVSSHLWKATLPANVSPGTHVVHVRATDRHGRQFDGRRVIRVTTRSPEAGHGD